MRISLKKKQSNYKIHLIVGARPNFIKLAPLCDILIKKKIKFKVIHTGQHHEISMSNIFFKDLNLPKPDINLDVNNKHHGEMTGEIMIKYEKYILKNIPNLVIVFGDVNSTLACAIVAKKLLIKVAHVESGLRSNDLRMPEEINRIIVDRISDILLSPSRDAIDNLLNEGIEKRKIKFVGNIMIDNIIKYRKVIEKNNILKNLDIEKRDYCLLTMHRPENVDDLDNFKKFIFNINKISKKILIVFPVHPRTNKILNSKKFKKEYLIHNIIMTKPLSYMESQKLIKNAKFVITDSGGIQEETSFYNVPCLTFRKNTERPITILQGSNKLVNIKNINKYSNKILKGKSINKNKIKFWDGKTAYRILREILKII